MSKRLGVRLILGVAILAIVAALLILAKSNERGIALVPLVAGLLVILALRMAMAACERRKAQLEGLVAELGLEYTRKADSGFRDAWSALPEVKTKGSVSHLLVGEVDGREVTIFQHTRQEGIMMIGTTPAPNIVAFSVYSSPAPGWPEVHITRRRRASRRRLRRGEPDGFLTGDASFDERRKVETTDERFVRALLNTAMREFLLQKDKVTWRVVVGRLCLIYTGGLRFSRVPASPWSHSSTLISSTESWTPDIHITSRKPSVKYGVLTNTSQNDSAGTTSAPATQAIFSIACP